MHLAYFNCKSDFRRKAGASEQYLYFIMFVIKIEGEILEMSNVVFSNTYKLKDGVSVPDFLLAIEQLIKEYVSKQKGYVSFRLLAEGDTWADSVTFETMDNLNTFLESSQNDRNELAEKFYSFLDFDTCKSNIYSVEISY